MPNQPISYVSNPKYSFLLQCNYLSILFVNPGSTDSSCVESDLTGASAFIVTGRQCGTKKPTYYITTKRYVMIRYLTLKRVSSNRGAAIGYLSYSRYKFDNFK